jgi:Domain of unknown function (DUF4328)
VIPRWGLVDRVEIGPAQVEAPTKSGPSGKSVRTALFVSLLVFAAAAVVYAARYGLLVFNRGTLLNNVVAIVATWSGVVLSVAAIGASVASAVLLVQWLVARRSVAYAHQGLPEPRSSRMLWLGCLVPLINLLWAPVYVIELATVEEHYPRLRRPIVIWWVGWVCGNVVSAYAVATRWAADAQGIANNTVMMVLAYLFAAATVAAAAKIVAGFERRPVRRPAHRWVMVPGETSAAAASAAPVELQGQEPAA